jgi:putative membrane protein
MGARAEGWRSVTAARAGGVPSSNDLADERTRLALQRTIVAHDRTLMAWVRTAVSLISFGFTIYKFFQTLRESQGTHETHLIGPRGVGLLMIGLAVGGLSAATFQYQRSLRQLRAQYSRYGPFDRSVSAAVATVVAALGAAGFVLVFLRQ